MTTFTLRPWRLADAEAITPAADNPNIAANLRNAFPSPYTLTDAEWFVSDCIARDGQRQIARAIAVGDQAVGSISVFVKEDVYEKSAELGYWLAEPYWGQGMMTEAVRQICREAFARFEILRIFAEPFADNPGSRRVLEKAGFTCEGVMRNGVFKNGQVHSYCMYSLLREELEP
ncbi:GNAT family protein [Oscillospiraceae bacterium 38-13]